MSKTIIYQLLPRLYGNTCTTRKPNGTIAENGCGKFNDINDIALYNIKSAGVTHVWYTGVLRHASTTGYGFEEFPANPNVVKGRAGSPYAVSDYYDVDPDLAEDVEHRMDEFKALVARTHANGMKCLIDFVPNHVARNYYSDVKPERNGRLGEKDDRTVEFAPNNNFYYLPGRRFVPPVNDKGYPYDEKTTKASGNNAFVPNPSVNDWYDTIKLNYGINFADGSCHFDPIPDTWVKMRDIIFYWIEKGVDGFRVDMAEMVPIDFWQWLIGQTSLKYPHIIFVAETYNPATYKKYIAAGFSLLYDKVGFYDCVRAVMRGERPASDISNLWKDYGALERNLLFFLENHDEQRLASEFFMGSGSRAKAGMMLAALFRNSALMVYFAQEVGEPGMDVEGFSGRDGRTSIFDYWGIELFQKYVGNHKYDDSALPAEAAELKKWYCRLFGAVQKTTAFQSGSFYDLMWANQYMFLDANSIYAFLRYDVNGRYLVVLNFGNEPQTPRLRIPEDAWRLMGSSWNECITAVDYLTGKPLFFSSVSKSQTEGWSVAVAPNDGLVIRI